MTQNGLTSIRPDFYSAASESVQLLIIFYAALIAVIMAEKLQFRLNICTSTDTI